MELIEALHQEVQRCRQDRDFPHWLLPLLATVAEQTESDPNRRALVAQLLDQLRNYDPYAGAGCFCDSASLADIERTLARIGVVADPSPRACGLPKG